MIVAEKVNNRLICHYSDSGKRIRQVETNVVYDEAVDVLPCRYTYVETDEYISTYEIENGEDQPLPV